MNDNEMLHLLDDEREFMPTKKKFMDRLETKDIRPGHARLIRFLPVEQGPKKTYWMRYGAHWIKGSRPLWCPRSTSIDAGGKGKNAECPLCDLAAELNGHSDERISGAGYRLSANPFWRTFVLVRGKSDGDDMEPVPSPKCFVPLEFNLSQQLFNDFIADYRDNMDLGPMSFMDPMNGFNHILTVKGRIPSIRISSKVKPICKEEDYDDIINSIFGSIILQQNKIASYNDLELAASKAEERIMNGGRGGDDDDDDRETRRRGDDREYSRRRDPGDYDEDDDRPRRRSRDDSERSERVQEDREDRREADEERPSRPARPAAPKAQPRSVERHEIASDDQDDGDDRDSGRATEQEPDDDDIDTSPSPAPAKVPAPSLPPRSAPVKTPPSMRAPLPPPPAAKVPAASSSKIDDDDGDLPEEVRDPVPPRKMDEAALGAVLDENAPPPVASQGSSAKPRAGLSDRLRRSLAVQDSRA